MWLHREAAVVAAFEEVFDDSADVAIAFAGICVGYLAGFLIEDAVLDVDIGDVLLDMRVEFP